MPDLSLGLTQRIIAECRAEGLSIPQTAYVLATAYWESGRTMQPVREAYYLGDRAEAYRKRLRYSPWYGRGLVQITWERNYLTLGQRIGVDLITDPDRALDPDAAVRILVIGMVEGLFTGQRLGAHISQRGIDYRSARRIINGMDCADQIAAIALDYEHALTPAPAYPSVRRGSRGPAVREAQTLLAAQGYDAGAFDGVFGPATERAARAFQASAGLVADGIIGPRTWAALIPDMET